MQHGWFNLSPVLFYYSNSILSGHFILNVQVCDVKSFVQVIFFLLHVWYNSSCVSGQIEKKLVILEQRYIDFLFDLREISLPILCCWLYCSDYLSHRIYNQSYRIYYLYLSKISFIFGDKNHKMQIISSSYFFLTNH